MNIVALSLCLLLALLPAMATAAAGCVEHYDPAVDYFPEKARLVYADGFKIDYFKHYKVLTVLRPWPGASETFRYVLVQCGTPVPEGFADTPIIQIPVHKVVALSSTQLPHLELLGELDRLIALGSLDRVYSPAVRRRITAGELIAVGWGTTINIEQLLQLAPDLTMATGYREPPNNTHPALQRAGIPVVINTEYAEPLLLGQTEWLKFTAAFFNKEGRAQQLVDAIAARYKAYAALTQGIPAEQRPTVFTGTLVGGVWYMPGGRGYLAQLVRAAGGSYVWADNDDWGNLYLDFEAVYGKAWQADVWLIANLQWRTRAAMTAADERYETFKAYREGRVYNNNARTTDDGGNDYWETGMMEPDLILADLIKILHPDLVPEHSLKYFRRLQ